VNPPVTAKIYPDLGRATQKTKDNLAQNGGICSTDPSIVSLPCGDAAVAGNAREGAIEIKAAWRARHHNIRKLAWPRAGLRTATLNHAESTTILGNEPAWRGW